MIEKNKRIYIKEYFNDGQQFKEGDIIDFDMPSFVTGEFEAHVYIDTDGDAYIKKSENYFDTCRDYEIRKPYDIEETDVSLEIKNGAKAYADTFTLKVDHGSWHAIKMRDFTAGAEFALNILSKKNS